VTARTVVEALYAAYNEQRTGDAAALYAPDARHEEIATAQVKEGRGPIQAGLEQFLRAFPDARWQLTHLVTDDVSAAATYILTGTLSEPLGPLEPRGQQLELRGVHVLRLGPLGIENIEDYWDASTFGRQMAST
jgi:steroid delta-isomerase-like uncharacterized protein